MALRAKRRLTTGAGARRVTRRDLIATDPPYLTFHLWLLIAVASLAAIVLSIRTGALAFVVINDTTFLSDLVLLLFLIGTAYCGTRAWRLSRELLAVQQYEQPAAQPSVQAGETTWVSEFFALTQQAGRRRQSLADALEDRLRGPHEVGWFVTETLTKLGLLGTVIGFLIMLTALIGAEQLEVSAMQGILRGMAAGMGIKIIATVIGLLCSIVLALQWVLLDRCAEKIVIGASLALAGPGGAQRNSTNSDADPDADLADAMH